MNDTIDKMAVAIMDAGFREGDGTVCARDLAEAALEAMLSGIKVTSAMIDAGLSAYNAASPLLDIDGEKLPLVLAAVYEAMERERLENEA